MKIKAVMKVCMCCDKCRTKAKKIAAVADGVISVAIEGNDKDLVVVTGESIDPVCLVALLRKKVGHTILVSVEEVKPKPKVEEKKPNLCLPICHPCPPICHPVSHCVAYEPVCETNPSLCSIM